MLLRYANRRTDVDARGDRVRELAAAIAIDQDLQTAKYITDYDDHVVVSGKPIKA